MRRRRRDDLSFALCVRNDGFGTSLETRRIYRVLPDPAACMTGQIRVVDKSGRDGLYPRDRFRPIELPEPGTAA